MNVNYYYALDDMLDEDGGGLLHLCRECGKEHYPNAQWASRGDDDMFCEKCEAQNNPADPL